MMKKKSNVFDIILKIILILVAILIIYWFIQLLFGKSPTLSQFNAALIIMIMGFLVKLYREIGETKVEIRYSFNKTKEDINSIKKKLYTK